MNLVEVEDYVLEHFRKNGFTITEWPSLHPALEWRPRMRVTRILRGRTSDAAIVVRESGGSYRQAFNWGPLVEARRQLPDLSILFAIPDGVPQEPLRGELQELGVGLYAIAADGQLAMVQAASVPFDDQVISYPIEPNLQYRNRMNVYKVFDNCTKYLWWLDKHFLADAFELLEDYWSQPAHPQINEIKLLGSNIVNQHELWRLRTHFSPFQQQLSNFGVQAEIRILTDAAILRTLHDRYVISKDVAFNMLPVGSLIKGQQGSLTLDENPPNFMSLWNKGNSL